MKKFRISGIIMALGVLLIAVALLLYLGSYLSTEKHKTESVRIADELISHMPEISDGFIYERSDYSMPVYELDGKNYVGVMEIPAYSVKLPVFANWDKGELNASPCRYMGSIYDGSLVVGGRDRAGQFDFISHITETDSVYITDMAGDRFECVVTNIEVTDDASTEKLTEGEYDLVLFARNRSDNKYVIIRCNFKTK